MQFSFYDIRVVYTICFNIFTAAGTQYDRYKKKQNNRLQMAYYRKNMIISEQDHVYDQNIANDEWK